MKKSILMITLLLVGCSKDDGYILEKSGVEKVPEELSILEEVNIQEFAFLETINYTDHRDYADGIMVYTDESESLYINVEEFIEFNRLNTEKLNIIDDEVYSVYYNEDNYYKRMPKQPGSFKYSIDFDYEKNELIISSIGFVDYLDKWDPTLPNNYNVEEYYKSTIQKEQIIRLDDYNMKLIYENGQMYVPFNLGNFLLSSRNTCLVPTMTNIVAMDHGSNGVRNRTQIDDLFSESGAIQRRTEQDSYQFLRLYIDHFHGLRDSETVRAYAETMDLEFPDKSITLIIEEMVQGLNDPHTDVVYAKNRDAYFFERGERLEQIWAYKDLAYCTTKYKSNVATTVIDDTLFMRINSFSMLGDYGEEFEVFKEYDNVVLDLMCNSGGYLFQTQSLWGHFTNDPITYYMNNVDGLKPETVTVDRALNEVGDTNFYILTSRMSYSAANLIANLFQDQGWGEVIGERSMGGACSVEWITLDSGYTLMSSSRECIADENNNILDGGVTPDYEFEIKGKYYETIYDYIHEESGE